ncbi:MAG TPA: hypothetical protein PK736_05120, partial [Bacteroidia bacterium]|nr:hypothetical protein [Bacteroidia bacterium]
YISYCDELVELVSESLIPIKKAKEHENAETNSLQLISESQLSLVFYFCWQSENAIVHNGWCKINST